MFKLKMYILPFLLFVGVDSGANDSTYAELLKKAKGHLARSEYVSAISLLDSCIKINGKDASIYNMRAIATIYSGPVNDEKNNKIAIRFFTQAIQLDSNNGRYYNNRGWCYQFVDNYTSSMRDFKKAMSLDTANVGYHGNILRVLWVQDKNKEAYAYADKTITRFPNDGYAYYVRGQLKRDYLHKYPEGNKDIKKSEELGWQQGIALHY